MAAIGTAQLPPTTAILTLGMVQRPSTTPWSRSRAATPRTSGAVEADPGASQAAAAATAAHDVLASLFPDQAADLQAKLDASLGAIEDGPGEGRRDRRRAGGGRGDARGARGRWSWGGKPHHPVRGAGRMAPHATGLPRVSGLLDRQGEAVPRRRRRGLPHGGPVRARQRGVRRRVQRGQDARRARPGSTPDAEQNALVAFWATTARAMVRVRAGARDREGSRASSRPPGCSRSRASRRADAAHRLLQRQVPLDVLATRHGHPRGGVRRQRRDRGGSGLGAARRQPSRRTRHRIPTTRPGWNCYAGARSAPCRSTSAPTRWP